MKSIKYFTLVILAFVTLSSCSKHKLLLHTEDVPEGSAEFQIFNDLAVRSGEAAANTTMYCVVLGTNDTLAYGSYPLNARNVIPSGGTTRFFVRKPGVYQLRGWKSYDNAKAGLDPDYETTITLTAGKQMVHIYNWLDDALVMDYDYPFIRADRPNSTEFIYFNFINVFEEGSTTDYAAMRPTTKRLQYQMRLNNLNWDGMPLGRTEWQDIGEPVAFGEMTGYSPVVIPNNGQGFSGGIAIGAVGYWACTVYTRILDADTGLPIVGEDYWSGIRLGRFLIHTCYTKNVPANGVMVYQFYAL